MNRLRKLSKELGEPFDDVVKRYARKGKSRLVTAGLIGAEYTWFLTTIRRRNLDCEFLPQQNRSGNRTESPRWPKGRPRLYERKPIEHNGFVWYPGEPMHHYLFERRKK